MTRLTLQAASQQHIPLLLAWVQDAHTLLMWSGTRFDWPLTAAALGAHIAKAQAATGDRRLLLGLHCETARPIAYAELIRIRNRTRRHGRLARIIVNPAERGHGYGTEFVGLLLDYGFERLHLDILDLYVFLSNQNAIACYRRAGFREWDVLVQGFRGPYGEPFDLVKMGVRRSEWLQR